MEDFIQRSIIAACIGMCGEGGKWKERYKRRAVVIVGRRNDKKKRTCTPWRRKAISKSLKIEEMLKGITKHVSHLSCFL